MSGWLTLSNLFQILDLDSIEISIGRSLIAKRFSADSKHPLILVHAKLFRFSAGNQPTSQPKEQKAHERQKKLPMRSDCGGRHAFCDFRERN
jgi:hypothetical protein